MVCADKSASMCKRYAFQSNSSYFEGTVPKRISDRVDSSLMQYVTLQLSAAVSALTREQKQSSPSGADLEGYRVWNDALGESGSSTAGCP
mmetsp:Transcript_9780/g.20895  ORF Transcript_9780/g.20895 Transcript_9780/m.20895 type:complete len:90 (+) Transcript_9780:257-526(+)